VRRSFVA